LERADDRAIRDFAKTNGFTIVSQDSDFADMARLHGHPPKVVWLRCGNQPIEFIEKLFRPMPGGLAHSNRKREE
jgi:predicted nuclease of predicted toxin-antitoxin system